MKSTKLVTFNREQIVNELNHKALDIVIGIHNDAKREEQVYILEDDLWTGYDKLQTNFSISQLKKKHLAYRKGQAVMLLSFVEDFDVYINKSAHNFLSHFTNEK